MKFSIHSPEVQQLRNLTESKIGFSLRSPRHFKMLSRDIERATGERLSETTLQRFWMYKAGYDVASVHTLDILCKYVGLGY